MTPTLRPQDIATSLQQHEETLRRLRLKSLFLFGSVSQGTHGPGSDLDLLYEFEEGAATLDHLLDLQDFLEDVLGRNIDLVPRKYMSPILQRYIEDDVVPVYHAGVAS